MRSLFVTISWLAGKLDGGLFDPGVFRRSESPGPTAHFHVGKPASLVGQLGTRLVLGPAVPPFALPDARRDYLAVKDIGHSPQGATVMSRAAASSAPPSRKHHAQYRATSNRLSRYVTHRRGVAACTGSQYIAVQSRIVGPPGPLLSPDGRSRT